jgi:hypothetical protein
MNTTTAEHIISTYTQSTSHIGLNRVPSNAYIISAVLISIIVMILLYFCMSENSRGVMFTLYWWLFALFVKIVMLVPSILILLFCYIYKAGSFIRKKMKNRANTEIVLENIVVINNTDVTTDTTTDTTTNVPVTDSITDHINYILKCYSCSGLLYLFSDAAN